MSVHDLSSFYCSLCGESIPDRDLEKLATVRLSENKQGIEVICGDCLSKEEESKKKRGTLVIMSEFKIKI